MMGTYDHIGAGTLLFSQPYVDDDFFGKSVILLTEHTSAGSVGFILNKPLTFHVGSLTSKLLNAAADISLCLGGPVGNTSLHYIHTLGGDTVPGASHVGSGLFWAGDFDIISTLVDNRSVGGGDVRFFLGYSGWSAGQLEKEISDGMWGVARMSDYDIMCDTSELWYRIVMNDPAYSGWRLLGGDSGAMES